MKGKWMETLNIIGKCDIYQENFSDIIDLCMRSLRGSTRLKPVEGDMLTRDNMIFGGSVTRTKIMNLLEDFKTDILRTLRT